MTICYDLPLIMTAKILDILTLSGIAEPTFLFSICSPDILIFPSFLLRNFTVRYDFNDMRLGFELKVPGKARCNVSRVSNVE